MTGDRELEALLQQALAEQAARVEPAGDGLTRIRERTRRRRGLWSRWSVPALALAGAAAVILGVTLLPSLLPREDGSPTQPGAQGVSSAPAPTSSAPATVGPTTPSPGRSPTVGPGPGTVTPPRNTSPTASPTAPVEIQDRQTVWPYATRREGATRADQDVRTGRYPNLRDPALTAVDFVASFVGRDGLTASRLDAYPPGLRMLVSRDGRPVSTVFLVRVRAADDAPYVVVSASRDAIDPQPSLAVLELPPAVGTAGLPVTGTVRRDAGAAGPTVTVQLREPGGTGPLARAAVPVVLDGQPVRVWSTTLSPARALTSTGVVAAWTVGADGKVLEFVAAPTGS